MDISFQYILLSDTSPRVTGGLFPWQVVVPRSYPACGLTALVYDFAAVLYCVIVIICPIAIAYSMGQIIKSVCVCQSVCVCVCLSVCPCVITLTVAFLCRFSPNLTQRYKTPKVNMSSLGVNIAPPLPLCYP